MSNKQKALNKLKASGVVAVIRTENPDDIINISHALYHGGVQFIEITMTIPGALPAIEKAVKALAHDDIYIGVGTVLDTETTRLAIIAGVDFVVSPVCRPEMITMCKRYDVAVMPGAMTPTEVLTAWEAGADVVKIFPGGVGGSQFFKDLKGPFPYIDIMPTGSVNRETAPKFISAGACAVGVGGELAGKSLIAEKKYATITKNARDFIEIVKNSRNA